MNEVFVAISPEGYLYGVGETELDAEEKAIETWLYKWGSDAYPMPDFIIKVDDGYYEL